MDVNEFNNLDRALQATLTWDGEFLKSTTADFIELALYAVNGFFVEVSYDLSTNQLLHFRAFDRKEELELYLEEIDILTLLHGPGGNSFN